MFSHDIKCISYILGHVVHWIQAMHARDSQTASVDVALDRRSNLHVDVIVDGQVESWRFHDTRVNRQHLDAWDGGEQARLRSHGLLLRKVAAISTRAAICSSGMTAHRWS